MFLFLDLGRGIISLLQCGVGNYFALTSQVSTSNNLLNQGSFS